MPRKARKSGKLRARRTSKRHHSRRKSRRCPELPRHRVRQPLRRWRILRRHRQLSPPRKMAKVLRVGPLHLLRQMRLLCRERVTSAQNLRVLRLLPPAQPPQLWRRRHQLPRQQRLQRLLQLRLTRTALRAMAQDVAVRASRARMATRTTCSTPHRRRQQLLQRRCSRTSSSRSSSSNNVDAHRRRRCQPRMAWCQATARMPQRLVCERRQLARQRFVWRREHHPQAARHLP